jgi:hypothetical protein
MKAQMIQYTFDENNKPVVAPFCNVMDRADFIDADDDLGQHWDDPDFVNAKWITINEVVIREISALQLVYKQGGFDHNWHIVGTLLGKRVSWELSELEGDDEDETEAKACLENLRNLVAAHPGKPLAVYYEGEQISSFKAVFTPTCIFTIEQQPDFGEDF